MIRLTGLANRARLIERLEAALAVLPPSGGVIAVHFIDIDHFKQVNDTLGHDGGDFLLSTIGKRLNAMTRIEDMVARLGGDEFVVVQTGMADKIAGRGPSRSASDRVLSAPIHFKEQEICPSYTIGVALAPGRRRHARAPAQERRSRALCRQRRPAATASASSRRKWTKPCTSASRSKRPSATRSRTTASSVHYQPVFEMADKQLIGFEALVRLPASGRQPDPAGHVYSGCRGDARHRPAWAPGSCAPPAPLPRKLARQFDRRREPLARPNSPPAASSEMVTAIPLAETGLAPHRLELEITEGLLLAEQRGRHGRAPAS